VTIERGQPWGTAGALPVDGVVASSDARVRAVVQAARRAGEAVPVIGLAGGDLWRTVGGGVGPARLHGDEAMHLPVDIGSVLLDGRQHWFVSHLVLRRSWWRGRVIAVMNAQFVTPLGFSMSSSSGLAWSMRMRRSPSSPTRSARRSNIAPS